MASMSALYSGSPLDLFNTFAGAAGSESDLNEDAAVTTQRLEGQFATRGLPDLANRYAGRGTFFSGGARVAADRLREDVDNQKFDIERMKSRSISALIRQRVLAAGGVL